MGFLWAAIGECLLNAGKCFLVDKNVKMPSLVIATIFIWGVGGKTSFLQIRTLPWDSCGFTKKLVNQADQILLSINL